MTRSRTRSLIDNVSLLFISLFHYCCLIDSIDVMNYQRIILFFPKLVHPRSRSMSDFKWLIDWRDDPQNHANSLPTGMVRTSSTANLATDARIFCFDFENIIATHFQNLFLNQREYIYDNREETWMRTFLHTKKKETEIRKNSGANCALPLTLVEL